MLNLSQGEGENHYQQTVSLETNRSVCKVKENFITATYIYTMR